MYFSKNKDINQLVLQLLQRGWTYSRGKHFKLFAPNRCGMVIVPTTPGDHRALQNFRHDVRQRLQGNPGRYRRNGQGIAP
ncbi:hypothetical protein [Pseudomonas sp. NPDC007930]|uniref:hypothetical protein n=1 Tax=Pseudomonas sp. NPDC007930 TaxID=3364417 RepID=UPI0036E35290